MNMKLRAVARRAAVLLLFGAGCVLVLGPAAAQDTNKETVLKESPLPPRPAPAEVQIITLKNAAAKDMALVVTDLLAGRSFPSLSPVTVTPDQATNALLGRGSAEQVAQVREIIAKLDVLRDSAPKATEVYSIALKNATATDTVSVLEHLLGGGGRVSIVAVPANNSLL